MKTDVVIIGAGAAGLFCAIEAGRRGRRVILVDHAKSPGEKIRISGGGRCNFTNLDIQPDRFLSKNPKFAVSALKRFTQWDFIARVDQAGIAWHEKTLGQLFCDGSSKEIIAMLVSEAQDAGVDLRVKTEVNAIDKTAHGFEIACSAGKITCEAVVIASGGKSIPKMGATGFGYQIAAQFGIDVTPTRPGLVPLTFAKQELEALAPLAGTSVQARVSTPEIGFEEGLLFTHRGLSGPSILQISSYWSDGSAITVDLQRTQRIAEGLKALRSSQGRISIKNALSRFLPEKLAVLLTAQAGVSGNLADHSNAKLDDLAVTVHNWTVKPVGTEGYRTAEVTLGGVDTDVLNARTMEVKSTPGLYFIGEVVDVTGWLGGYNFQWAWSSGWAAGQVV